jgi:hypothetical protein
MGPLVVELFEKIIEFALLLQAVSARVARGLRFEREVHGPARTHGLQNVPATWEQLWAERNVERFEHPRLQIEVSQIIIHKADQQMSS